MTRREGIVCAVILGEIVIGIGFLFWWRNQPSPPVPNLSLVDPLVAKQLHDQAQRCRSTEDWARLGEAYVSYGYFLEGEACYRQAAQWQPANGERAFDWAFSLERLAETTAANEQYQKAIEHGYPAPADCWYFIGRNWLRAEQAEQAEQAREAFLKAGDHPSSRYELARLLVRDGKLAEADQIAERLSAEFPLALHPYQLRCRITVFRDDPRAEVRFGDLFNRVHDRLPTPFDQQAQRLEDGYERLGLAREWKDCRELLNANKTEEAERRLRAALAYDWDPNSADLLAEVELQRHRPQEAVRLLSEVVERAGPNVQALIRLGDA